MENHKSATHKKALTAVEGTCSRKIRPQQRPHDNTALIHGKTVRPSRIHKNL